MVYASHEPSELASESRLRFLKSELHQVCSMAPRDIVHREGCAA